MAAPTSLTTATPTPLPSPPPDFNSSPAWQLPGWFEPVIVVTILFGACYFTRRRRFSLLRSSRKRSSLLDDDSGAGLLSDSDLSGTSTPELSDLEDDDETDFVSFGTLKNPPKRRNCCGMAIHTPNTSRFKHNFHSRIMQKFPFLLEMFYWVLTYALYRLTHVFAQAHFSESIWDVAQENGLRVLWAEQFSWARFAFPIQEIEVQKWFMANHGTFLTVLNKFYALVHIPGGV